MCRITSGASKSRSPDASAPAHLPPPESRHRSGPRPGSAPPGCRTRRGAVRTPRPSALQPAHDLRSPPPAPAPRAAPPRQPAAASARRARRWHRVPGESSFQPPRRSKSAMRVIIWDSAALMRAASSAMRSPRRKSSSSSSSARSGPRGAAMVSWDTAEALGPESAGMASVRPPIRSRTIVGQREAAIRPAAGP